MKKTNKIISLVLTAVLLLGLLPALAPEAEAANGDAGKYLEVMLGYGRIGNKQYSAQNLYQNFKNGLAGFSIYEQSGLGEWSEDGFGLDTGDYGHLRLTVSNNDVLKALAKSPTAKYRVSGYVKTSDSDWHTSKAHWDYDQADIRIYENSTGNQILYAHSPRDDYATQSYDTGWRSFTGMSQILIHADSYNKRGGGHNADDTEAQVHINFQLKDEGIPTLTYTCTNGATVNSADNKELLVKLGTNNTNSPETYYYDAADYSAVSAAMESREWVDLRFNFSKPVSMASANNNGALLGVSNVDFEAMSEHILFTNAMGTGYLGQGDNRGLELYKVVKMDDTSFGSATGGKLSPNDVNAMNNFLKSMSYRYAASYGDFSSNKAIPDGGGIEQNNAYGVSLFQKIYNAGFHDAAGNPLAMPGDDAGVNIFDKTDGNGGYDVIVDAVPPTYTKVGNGVVPDILTQLVLNKNDSIDFIVSFSEATITKRGWDNAKTYLMLDNGDRAYFQSKSQDGKQWIFHYDIPAGTEKEATLLKVVALSNDALNGSLDANATGRKTRGNDAAYTYNVDGRTITDYVGNVLVERANEDASTNEKQIQSSTGWAGLAIDNQAPSIAFTHNQYGTLHPATTTEWGQAAKLFTAASDPDVAVAKYDPEYDATNNATRPSKGIYRPDSTTGSTASAVGLIFYVWSTDPTPPDTGTNYEAIKRYSLTGEQPKAVEGASYADAWAALTHELMMANNYSDIVPPADAMTDESSGAWYLHVWTADMTWDSARQLMQYEKAKTLQYNGGYDEAAYLALKQQRIEEAVNGSFPSYDEAWSAVQKTVYETAFQSTFIDRLKTGGVVDYSEEALANAQTASDSSVLATVYKEGQSADTFETVKANQIKAYRDDINNSLITEKDAWTAVKPNVYKTVFADAFAKWLISNGIEFDVSKEAATALDYAVQMIQYKSETLEDTDEDNQTISVTTQYDASSVTDAKKTAFITEYKAEHTDASDSQAETAWRDFVYSLYSTTFTGWLTEATRVDANGVFVKNEQGNYYKVKVKENSTEYPYEEIEVEKYADKDGHVYQQANGDPYPTVANTIYDAAAMTYALNKANAQATKDGAPTIPYNSGYNADGYPTAKTNAITAMRQEEKPSEDAAWTAVKATVFATVYTDSFVGSLNGDLSEFTAKSLIETKLRDAVYKTGYNAAQYAKLKQREISKYRSKTNSSSSGGATSYAEAWEKEKKGIYETAYTTQFIAWLDESGSDRYSDAAMLYAKSQTLLQQAKYKDKTVWPRSDFQKDDSNWTVSTARVLLDNAAPTHAVYDRANIYGEGTAYVEVPVTVSDGPRASGVEGDLKGISGLDQSKLSYLWALKSAAAPSVDDVNWVAVAPADQTATAVTNQITDSFAAPNYGKASISFLVNTAGLENGEYILYIKSIDMAGNTTISSSTADADGLTVTVDSNNAIAWTFGPAESIGAYRSAIVPTVTVEGVTVGKLEYAVTNSVDRPDSGFAAVAAATKDDVNKVYTFTLPALTDGTRADGVWYVHTRVFESAEQTTEARYYSRQAYYLDQTPPTVIMNPNGAEVTEEYADTLSVGVKASDMLAGVNDAARFYQISPTATPLSVDAPGWKALPANGTVSLSDSALRSDTYSVNDDTAFEYYVQVYVEDMTGNRSAVTVSGCFRVVRSTGPVELPEYGCQILTVNSIASDTAYGIANLTLEAADKAGYRYSVSSDGGESWCNWLPYMSMIRLDLSPDYADGGKLFVKFRGPDGTVGEPKEISIQTLDDPIWATAEFDSTFKRKSGNPLTFLMNLPDGVTATPIEDGYDVYAIAADVNFTVNANGVYGFQLSRGGQDAPSPLIIIVDIFDNEKPITAVTYSDMSPTNGSVIVTARASEPVYVKSLEVMYDGETAWTAVSPKFQFSFAKNGQARFILVDEAGNESDPVIATVANIDKDAPNVKVTPNFDLYPTLTDDNGNVTMAAGATLAAEKETPADEDFAVVNNDRLNTMEINQNGDYTFIVQDNVGNIAQVTHAANYIYNSVPDYTLTFQYADGTAVNLDNPEVRKGTTTATVTFNLKAGDARGVYLGATKINEVRKGVNLKTGEIEDTLITNLLKKDANGKYTYSREFSAGGNTSLVFCDDLGNVERVPISITWLDNAAPTLTFDKSTAIISSDQMKRLNQLTTDEVKALFGGYTLSDNVSAEADITVTVARSDDQAKTEEEKGRLDEVGKFTLIYTVTDKVGNSAKYEQTLIVIPADGLLIQAGKDSDYSLLSGSATNSAILPNNHVTFKVDKARMQAMFYNGQSVGNDLMEYDIFYVSGLYREGQLKTIATRIGKDTYTADELLNGDLTFEVTFPEPGWYTIIIRNQERTREYTTFFIGSASE